MTKKLIYKIAYVFAAFLLCVMTVMSGIVPALSVTAETVEYSSVLDDLKKDISFSANNYPLAAADYSLQVIQLAESSDKELFVYVYQPSGQAKDLKASSINISITINDAISFHNYKLQLIDSSGVFYKYIVKDFTVNADSTRYYAISSIYRPFDKTIDKDADHGNTVTEVNYAVNKQYCFSVINGKPSVSYTHLTLPTNSRV